MPNCLLPIRIRPHDYQPEDRRHRAEGRDFMSANIPKHPDLRARRGSVEISATDWSLVEPYRFGSRTAEFLIAALRHLCRRHLRDPGRRPRSDQRQLSRRSSRFHPATRARRSRRRNSRRPPCPPRCLRLSFAEKECRRRKALREQRALIGSINCAAPSHMAQLVACVSRGRYDLEPVILLLTRGAYSR